MPYTRSLEQKGVESEAAIAGSGYARVFAVRLLSVRHPSAVEIGRVDTREIGSMAWAEEPSWPLSVS